MMLMFASVMGVGGFWLWQRSVRKPKRALNAQTLRMTDPQRQGRALSRVWQLQTHGCQCQYARNLGGRRLDIEDALPLLGGASQGCRCYYRPLSDERRRLRRGGEERRAGLRFDLAAPERRMHAERRRAGREWQLQFQPR